MRNKKFKPNYSIGTKPSFIFMLLFGLFCQIAIAQNQVNGVVNDSQGVPLPGVNIVEKGTNNGVVSDFDGNYSMTVGDNATLVFSYLGFKSKEVGVNNRSTINTSLEEDTAQLDEVVVIGYGTQLKENLSGSVSTIKTEALKDIPQVGIDQLIQGRAAGVAVTQNSGQPGAAVSVRIRGVNSITGTTEPLYIIDGVPISGDANNSGTSGVGAAQTDGNGLASNVSPLAALNPNDIESVSVLKDASATAIYGSRGSNGVVIITTKKGKKGKDKFTYSNYIAVQRATNKLSLLNLQEYAGLQNSINETFGSPQDLTFLNPSLLGAGTDWQNEVFRDALLESHQISFSGANENTDYFISASYLDQEGTVIGSGFDRYTIRTNINSQVKDWLKVGISLTASRTNEDLVLSNDTRGLISLAVLNSPGQAVFNPDGTFAGPTTPEEAATGRRNPIADATSISNKLRRSSLLGNIYADFKLGKNLNYKMEVGGNFSNLQSDLFRPTFTFGISEDAINSINRRRETNDFWVVKNFLTYHNKFGENHNFTALLGHETQESRWDGVIASDSNFIGNDVIALGTGAGVDVTDDFRGSTALQSFFGRLLYTYSDRYNLTASLRSDSSSKFAKGFRTGYFPSVAGSWRLSNEKFMENFTTIQNIKIFGGYGEVGNQEIPPNTFDSNLNAVNTGLGPGFEFGNFGNRPLTWESSAQTNLGIDFSFFDSSFNATVEVYNKVSKDFLIRFAATEFVRGGTAPGAIQAPVLNLGEATNKGIDVTLGYSTKPGSAFSWNSNLTVSHYKNEVTRLLDGTDLEIFQSLSIDDQSRIVTRTQAGDPIGLFYGFQTDGLFRTLDDINGAPVQFGRPFEDALFNSTWLGDVKFKDTNGDGIVDDEDRTVIGDPNPDFTFGFQNSFNYKNFDLSVFMQGSYGNDVFNALKRTLTASTKRFNNQSRSVLDFYSVSNPNGTQPRLTDDATPNINISDRYIEDGSYLRIQNVTLGYRISPKALEKVGMSTLRIYGSIQNLYTFTKYSGYDPEVGNLNQSALLSGIDNGRFPTPRTFTLGLNVEF